MHALLVGEHLRQPHGDPKPSNLIIADHPGGGLFLQVQDWGLSLARHTHPPETLWFRAPELHAGHPPTAQSDLFTAAGSLFCLATNTAPTQGTTVEEVMRGWQMFNAGHVLSHLRPDVDPPLRDWLGWLLNPAPHLRPHAVGQALDMLMHSMQAGFTYMPQQAPAMAPGAQTTPLAAAPPPQAPKPAAPAAVQAPAPAARPQTPASKPIAAKAAPAAAIAPAAEAPAVTKRKMPSRRVVIAAALNFAALILLGIIFTPFLGGPPPSEEASATESSPKTTAKAEPKKAAKPSAVTASDAKGH